MKFQVFGRVWASGGVDPQVILSRYVAATPVVTQPDGRHGAPSIEVEITPEELMTMATAREFDILVSGTGYIAFDGKGRGFRQR